MLNIFLRQQWEEPRMRYEPFPGQRIPMALPSNAVKDMWIPDTFFPNEKQADFHKVTVPNQLVRIYPNGTVVYSAR